MPALPEIQRSLGADPADATSLLAAIVSADLVLDGRFAAESGFGAAFRMSATDAAVATAMTVAIPPRGRARAGASRAAADSA